MEVEWRKGNHGIGGASWRCSGVTIWSSARYLTVRLVCWISARVLTMHFLQNASSLTFLNFVDIEALYIFTRRSLDSIYPLSKNSTRAKPLAREDAEDKVQG